MRAIVLGSLLPPTGDAEKDLEIYEQLLAFDKGGLARRALANNAFKPKEIAQTLTLTNPWHYFAYTLKDSGLIVEEVESWQTPFDSDERRPHTTLAARPQRDRQAGFIPANAAHPAQLRSPRRVVQTPGRTGSDGIIRAGLGGGQ